jgi:hypothetical protein
MFKRMQCFRVGRHGFGFVWLRMQERDAPARAGRARGAHKSWNPSHTLRGEGFIPFTLVIDRLV